MINYLETLLPLIIGALPSLAAVITIITAVIKTKRDTEKIIKPIKAEIIQLRKDFIDNNNTLAINNLIQSNAMQAKQIKRLADAIEKVESLDE